MNRGLAYSLTAIVTGFFAIFFLYPAVIVLKEAFYVKGEGLTFGFIREVFANPVYVEGLWNAFALGITSTLGSLLIAFPLALLGHRYLFAFKKSLSALILIPLVLPPFVGAVGVKQILGSQGALNALLANVGIIDAGSPVDWLGENRFMGIVIMNALHLYPILYMNIAASLSNIDPAMEQAAQNLGCPPWRRLLRITLPLCMPGIFAGGAIVFIWSFTELGVPLVFDYTRVAPVQVFNGIKDLGANPFPYALVAIMLVISTTVFLISKAVLGRSKLGTAPRPKGRANEIPLKGVASFAVAAFFFAIFFISSLPHLGVVFLSMAQDWYATVLPEAWTADHYREALGHPLVVPSIQNSLLYATGSTLIDVVLGIAIAWVIVRSNIRGRAILDALVMLPLAVPGLVLAFGYLALSREGQGFHWLVGATEDPTYLIIIAYAVRRLPYVVRSAVAGLQQSNIALEEAAQSLGATPARTLRRVALPLLSANLIAGSILAFAFAMLEVSDSLILAQQAEHFPITKAIYSLLGMLGNGYELAAALGVWAMAFLSIAIIGAVVLGGKKGGLFRM
ncbi:MAG: iron ABC transporter permease [Akkermansiaceae bacterium]|nr:iron ABC transporter permease [Akkermansiaceae bacterium]